MSKIEQDVYTKTIDGWVTGRTAQKIDWSALVDSLPSVYPETVRDSALRLGAWSNVCIADTAGFAGAVASIAYDLWLQRKLRTPHVLDGCWWFTDDALRLLSELACGLGVAGDAIGLFGAPTLYYYMRRQGLDREVMLVDRALSSDLAVGKTIQADVLERTPALSRLASVSVVDPPWYGPETKAFLLAARRNSILGGKILLSVPPIGTRPGIVAEWEELLDWCKGAGLELIERMPLALRYLSPPFELNALRAAAVPACRTDWRRGDLAVFECFDAVEIRRAPAPATYFGVWRDLEVGRVHLKLRVDGASEQQTPLLAEIVPSGVLPTVSRRDGRAQSVTLWTSGNRVFSSGAPTLLGKVLDAVVANERVADLHVGGRDSFVGYSEMELTATRLRRIIEIEELELEHWSRSLNASLVELAS